MDENGEASYDHLAIPLVDSYLRDDIPSLQESTGGVFAIDFQPDRVGINFYQYHLRLQPELMKVRYPWLLSSMLHPRSWEQRLESGFYLLAPFACFARWPRLSRKISAVVDR